MPWVGEKRGKRSPNGPLMSLLWHWERSSFNFWYISKQNLDSEFLFFYSFKLTDVNITQEIWITMINICYVWLCLDLFIFLIFGNKTQRLSEGKFQVLNQVITIFYTEAYLTLLSVIFHYIPWFLMHYSCIPSSQ